MGGERGLFFPLEGTLFLTKKRKKLKKMSLLLTGGDSLFPKKGKAEVGSLLKWGEGKKEEIYSQHQRSNIYISRKRLKPSPSREKRQPSNLSPHLK